MSSTSAELVDHRVAIVVARHPDQLVAINRTVDANARGENRILLVMATGTGKTFTAFQIIWRLWKSGARKEKT